MSSQGRLSVAKLFEVTNRGPFLAGDIIDGELRVGMFAEPLMISGESRQLEVKAVEFLDSVSTREFWVAVGFGQQVTLSALQLALNGKPVVSFAAHNSGEAQ